MADVKLGDRVRARINYGMEGGGLLPAEEGTVVYVHPEGRFYTVEFTFPKGKFREAYLLQPWQLGGHKTDCERAEFVPSEDCVAQAAAWLAQIGAKHGF